MTTKNPHTAEKLAMWGLLLWDYQKMGKNVITPRNNEKKLVRVCLTSY